MQFLQNIINIYLALHFSFTTLKHKLYAQWRIGYYTGKPSMTNTNHPYPTLPPPPKKTMRYCNISTERETQNTMQRPQLI